MSLKYCPACGKVEDRFPNKMLFVAMALSITAVILIACRCTFNFNYSTDSLLEFFSLILSVVSLGMMIIAVVLGFRKQNKSCACGSKFTTMPNYELIGAVLIWMGGLLINDWQDDLRSSVISATIFLAGILIFVFAPVAKLATLKLYRELYPVQTSTLNKVDTKVSLHKD